MNKLLLSFIVLVFSLAGMAQDMIRGYVIDNKTNQPVEGATVMLLPSKTSAITDITGKFSFKGKYENVESIQANSIGYGTKMCSLEDLQKNDKIYLTQQQGQLEDLVIVAHAGSQYSSISRTDIAMRGVNNSQEVLRIVPGLFIGQHQGGGKAEQIFLRGFDCDHGTDIALFADGIPVNMVSHAHGQGYADSHFIIPETIESSDFRKGTYYAEKGDFCTSGFVNFNSETRSIQM